MNHEAFVRALRANPDDNTLRLIFADWYEENNQLERAEYIRAACRLASLPLSDPDYLSLQRQCLTLYSTHHREWVGEWPADMEWSFDRGLLTGVTASPERLAERWVELFSRHPIHRVRLSTTTELTTGGMASFGWLSMIDTLRVFWVEPGHRLFGDLDPGDLRFRRLWLDGDPDPEQMLQLLRGRTHEVIEAFRYNGLDHKGPWHDQREDFHQAIEVLSGSPLRELGLMFRRHAITPIDVERVLQADIAPQLHWLDLSSGSGTIVPGEPLVNTGRLPSLRRLDHGNYHGFPSIVRNHHSANLTTLGTEWSAETDRILADSPFLTRATSLQFWHSGWDVPESGVPLADRAFALRSLHVQIDGAIAAAAPRWVQAPWAPGLRTLTLRGRASGYGSGILPFVRDLARTAGLPSLRSLSVIVEGDISSRQGAPVHERARSRRADYHLTQQRMVAARPGDMSPDRFAPTEDG